MVACPAAAPLASTSASQDEPAMPLNVPAPSSELQKMLYKEQKVLVDCIRDKSKRIRKLAKKVRFPATAIPLIRLVPKNVSL
jgi:hypothetical protein